MSVAYIGPKSRTERPRKTKIGTEVKGQGQKVKDQLAGAEAYCGGLSHSLLNSGECSLHCSAPECQKYSANDNSQAGGCRLSTDKNCNVRYQNLKRIEMLHRRC